MAEGTVGADLATTSRSTEDDSNEIDPQPTDKTSKQEDKSDKRVRTLTEKGKELFENEVLKYTARIDSIWEEIENIPTNIENTDINIKELRVLSSTLDDLGKKYEKENVAFLEYLTRTNTAESLKELDSHRISFDKGKQIIQDLRKRIRDSRMNATEAASQKSGSSSSSSVNSVLFKKRVEAEAQRTKLLFKEREVAILREKASLKEAEAKLQAENERKKAELEATQNLLEEERKAAVVDAEVKALEMIESDSKQGSLVPPNIDTPMNRTQYTARYISDHSENNVNADYVPLNLRSNTDHITLQRNQTSYRLNPMAKEFVCAKSTENQNVVSDLTRFLLKKDLLFSRFSNFSDQPEAFATWKASFKNIAEELHVTPFEEMDLLVKFLGPESSQFAASIRAANTAYPERGLERLWKRLYERYGSPELVESALKTKLRDFPRITNKDNKRLYDLVDILTQIEAVKEDPNYSTLLSYFDSSSGIIPIVSKLPFNLQEKWTMRASSYKLRLDIPYPPFSYFVDFLQEMSKIRNDPGFQYEGFSNISGPIQNKKTKSTTILTCKTELEPNNYTAAKGQKCPIHDTYHNLKDCKTFRSKPLSEKKRILKFNGLCFRCLNPNHLARDCTTEMKCSICDSDNHHTALHENKTRYFDRNSGSFNQEKTDVQNKCTVICGTKFKGKSCSKTVLINVYPTQCPSKKKSMYAIIDDQSSRTLARSKFFDLFDIHTDSVTYTLSSCSGTVTLTGRCASNFTIEPVMEGKPIQIHSMIECDDIPNCRNEIPTPDVARAHPHLADLTSQFPDLKEDAEILLLIGRDHPEVHHVLTQRTGPYGAPFAQKLSLGWTIIGECCLDKTHVPNVVTNKTYVLPSGRSSTFLPCPAYLDVSKVRDCTNLTNEEITTSDIFVRTPQDNELGLSINDREFLKIMDSECYRDKDGYWTAPLPFKANRQKLPNNRKQAMKRTLSFISSCKRNPLKMEHAISFMDKVFSKGHAESAPALQDGEECWFLPIFGVYNPKKPNQIRMVFDSSATFQKHSLNSVLLSGPDLTNSLHGILLRFRKEKVAVTGDIEQMFHSFKIREDHRNFVRFIWYKDNDPTLPLVEYRMCVHLFGNSPSPAVATYCLRKCVQDNKNCDSRVSEFVNRNFYVDDGLISYPIEDEALEILRKTQTTLKEEGNLRFHKFASNSAFVMDHLPVEDRATGLVDVNLDLNPTPFQRTLGLTWNLQSDTFTYQLMPKVKDLSPTKREILSSLNSLYDPLGFISPVILQGRFIFREVINLPIGWDDTIPMNITNAWKTWCNSLQYLSTVQIPRTIVPISLRDSDRIEMHLFSDASEKAVCAVAYLRVTSVHGNTHLGFLAGKSKLSPQHCHTIPRLELCAAVLSTELAAFVLKQIDVSIQEVNFYTDSRIVLGYIYNETRRFHTYVANRVQRIRQHSNPDQWDYISTDANPADVGSRGILANELPHSMWLRGPDCLHRDSYSPEKENFPLVDPENDNEIKITEPSITSQKTCTELNNVYQRIKKFSSWTSVIRAFSALQRVVRRKLGLPSLDVVHMNRRAELFLLKMCQKETFFTDIANIANGKPVPKDSPLRYLDPYLDDGILRLGGRIHTGDALADEHGPIIIHGKTYLARLLVLHYHNIGKHQGRHLTEGIVRSSGYWVIGGKKLVSSVIHSCITCRKLRRQVEHQKMGNLPECRLKPSPPFTYVGVDAFGPWEIIARKTRGGSVNSKRWAILFTCLTCRAVHLELIEDMSSSTFINALRRFIAVRGKVTEFRSDRGTNFVGSTDALQVTAINVESPTVRGFLTENRCSWIFNPPHSSHMGGVWERMIGIARRILDSMLLKESKKNLTHDVLNTLMAEVSAIMNSRPIVPVSTDPSQPSVLSPYMLLTQKTELDVGPFELTSTKDMFKSHWKYIQVLADQFWKRWHSQYLQLLHSRRKWIYPRDNLAEDDVVLLKESSCPRNDWPMGVVQRVFPGEDGRVRKIELRVIRNDRVVTYVRPVTEVVLLFTP